MQKKKNMFTECVHMMQVIVCIPRGTRFKTWKIMNTTVTKMPLDIINHINRNRIKPL